ncbi:hypothetical protein JXA47_17175 [Candidatus Sumerlaeota bacterium]|nr:hypothetical protein [Candidatus Sumerlaeota bacterium]
MSPRFEIALATLAILVIPVAIIAFNWAGEDCWITYRYAENFGEGHGLVFNPGDTDAESRVEGYSNPSLTVMLGVIHWLGGSVVYGSRWIAILSAALTVWLLGRFSITWLGAGKARWLCLLAPALFALHPLVQYQIGRALETTLHTALLVVAALMWLRGRPLGTSLALGLVALTRPEGFLFIAPFVAVWALEWWFSRSERGSRLDWAALAWLVIPWALIVAAIFLWRHAHYGHWFPNSVTLKTTPGSAGSSLRLVRNFVISWSFLPLAVPLACAGFREMSAIQRRGLLLCGFLMAHQLVFIIAVGDVAASAYRHFIPIIPFACLCLARVADLMLASIAWRPLRAYLILALMAASIFTVSNGDGSRTRLHVRLREFVHGYGGEWNSPISQFAFHWRWFHSPPIRIDTRAGLWMREHLPPDALVAADQMGQLAYHAGQPMLDLFGLMDEHIARAGLDLNYVFARNPDFVVFMWWVPSGDYTPFQQPLRDDPRFGERYRLRWRLRLDNGPYEVNRFHIFVRRDLDDGLPVEDVLLPGSFEESERFWRVWEGS